MKKIRQFIAAAILICFVPNQLAASSLPAPAEVRLPAPEFKITLPSELGKIERVHSGTGPALIHIQSAHGNYEGEQKINSILHYLKKQYGFETVLLEGTSFEPSRGKINFFPENENLTLKTIDLLIRKALMKGSELFLFKEKAAKGYGIEKLDAYVRNGEAFKAVLTQTQKSESFLNEFEELIERFAGTYLNKDLRRFVRETQRLETNELSSGSFDYLIKSARRHLDLNLLNPENQFEWPMLTRFARLRWIEKRMDHAAFENERPRFIQLIKNQSVKKDAEFLLGKPGAPGWNAERGRVFLDSLAEAMPAGFSFADFPNVRLVLAQETFRLELDPTVFFQETGRLKNAVSEKLVHSSEEREIYGAYEHYQLLKKLLQLEITPAEHEKILKLKNELRPAEILRKFSEIEKDGRVRTRDFSRISEIEELFALALEFYAGVKERDGLMLERIEERLKQTGARKAVVITGGFHAAPFEEHFSARGFNYALVTPLIQSGEGRNEYVGAVLQLDPSVKKSTREVPFPYSVERTAGHLEEVGGSYRWYDLQLDKAKKEASTAPAVKETIEPKDERPAKVLVKETVSRSESRISKSGWRKILAAVLVLALGLPLGYFAVQYFTSPPKIQRVLDLEDPNFDLREAFGAPENMPITRQHLMGKEKDRGDFLFAEVELYKTQVDTYGINLQVRHKDAASIISGSASWNWEQTKTILEDLSKALKENPDYSLQIMGLVPETGELYVRLFSFKLADKKKKEDPLPIIVLAGIPGNLKKYAALDPEPLRQMGETTYRFEGNNKTSSRDGFDPEYWNGKEIKRFSYNFTHIPLPAPPPPIKGPLAMNREKLQPFGLQELSGEIFTSRSELRTAEPAANAARLDPRLGTVVRPDLLLWNDIFARVEFAKEEIIRSAGLDGARLKTLLEEILDGRRQYSLAHYGPAFTGGGVSAPWTERQFSENANNQTILIAVAAELLKREFPAEAESFEDLQFWIEDHTDSFLRELKSYVMFKGVRVTRSLVQNQTALERTIKHERFHEPISSLLYTDFPASDARAAQKQALIRSFEIVLQNGGRDLIIKLLGNSAIYASQLANFESQRGQPGRDLSFVSEFWVNTIYPGQIIWNEPLKNGLYAQLHGLLDGLTGNPEFLQVMPVIQASKAKADLEAARDISALTQFRSEVRAEIPRLSEAREKVLLFRSELDQLSDPAGMEVFLKNVQEYENLIFRSFRKMSSWEKDWEPLVGELSQIRAAAKSKFEVKPPVETEEAKIRRAWTEIKSKVQVYGSKKLIERASYTWEFMSGFWMITLKDAAGLGKEWADCTAASCVAVQALNAGGIPSVAYALKLPSSIQVRPADTRDFSKVTGWSDFETQFSKWKLASNPEINSYPMGHGVVRTQSGYILDASDYSFTYSNDTPGIWREKDFPLAAAIRTGTPMPVMARNLSEGLSFPLVTAQEEDPRFPYSTANQPLQIRRLPPAGPFIATLTTQIGTGYFSSTNEIVFSFNVLYRLYDPSAKIFHVPQSVYLQWAVPVERFFSAEQAEIRKALASGDADQMLAFFSKRKVKLTINDNARGDLSRSFPAAAGRMREIMAAAKEDMPSFFQFISKIPALPPSFYHMRSEMRGLGRAVFEGDGSWTYPDTETVGYSLGGKVFADDRIQVSISKLSENKQPLETAGPILIGAKDEDFEQLLKTLRESFEPFSIMDALRKFHRDEESAGSIKNIIVHLLALLSGLIFTPLHFIIPAIPLLGAKFFKQLAAKNALDLYFEKVKEKTNDVSGSARSEVRSAAQTPSIAVLAEKTEQTVRPWFALLAKIYRVRIGYQFETGEVEGRIQDIVRRSGRTLRNREDMLGVYAGNTVLNLIDIQKRIDNLRSGSLDPKDWLAVTDAFQAIQPMLDVLTNPDPRGLGRDLTGTPLTWPELAAAVKRVEDLRALWKRDYEPSIPFAPKEIREQDYRAILDKTVRYGLYDQTRMGRNFQNLARVLKEGRAVFLGFDRPVQFEIYKLANLLGLSDEMRLLGIDFSELLFSPSRVMTTQDSIRPQFSEGYAVSMVQRGDQPIYSALRTRDYRNFRAVPGVLFPLENANVLSLAGGQGLPLIEMSALFKNSRLVLLDANAENIRKSFDRLDAHQASSSASGNQFEVRLADARHGFEGIPYQTGHFDFIAMTGRAEYGMSRDDLTRILRETFRALKPGNGYFLIESDGPDFLARYREVIADLIRLKQIDFPVETKSLSPNVLLYISRGSVKPAAVQAGEVEKLSLPLEADSLQKLTAAGIRFVQLEGTTSKTPLSEGGAAMLARILDLMNSPVSPGKFVLERSETDAETAVIKRARSEVRAEEGLVIENLVVEGVSARTLGLTPLSRIMTWEAEPQRMNPSLVRANDKAHAAAAKVANEQKALEEIWREIVAKLTDPTPEERRAMVYIDTLMGSINAMIAAGRRKSQEVIRESVLDTGVLDAHPKAREIIEKELLPALEERDEFLFLSNAEEVKGVSLSRAREMIIDRYQEMVMIRLYQIILNLPYGFRTDNPDVSELQRHLAASRKGELENEIPRILNSIREGNSPRTAVQGSIDRVNRAIYELDIAIKGAANADERTSLKTLRTIAVEQIGYLEKIGSSFDTYNYIYEQKDLDKVKKQKKRQELSRHRRFMDQSSLEFPRVKTAGFFKRALFAVLTFAAWFLGLQVTVSNLFRNDPGLLKARFDIFIRAEIQKGRPLQYASAKFFYENRELVSKEFWGFLMRYFDLAEYGQAHRQVDNPIIVYAKEIRNESDYNRLIASFQGHGKIVAIVAPRVEGEMRIPHWFIYAKKEGILVLTSLDMRKTGIGFDDLTKEEGKEYKGMVDVKQGRFVINPTEKTQDDWRRMGEVYDVMDRYFWSRAKKQAVIGLRNINYLADETNIDSIEKFDGRPSVLDNSGADGIGLFRLEELLTAQPSRTGIELDGVRIQAALSEILSYPGFREGKSMVIRLNDVGYDKRPQFLVEGSKGLRGWDMDEILRNKSGARFYLDPENYPEFYEFGKMQLKAIFAAHLQKKVVRSGVKILFSDVRSAQEMEGLETLILAAKKEFIEEVTSAGTAPKIGGEEHEDFTLSLSTFDPDEISREIDRIPVGYMFEETSTVKNERAAMMRKAAELKSRRKADRFIGIGSNDLSKSISREFYAGKMPLDELNPLLVRDIFLIKQEASKYYLEVNLEGEWGGSIPMLFVLVAIYEMTKDLEITPVAATAQIPELLEFARQTYPDDLLTPSDETPQPLSFFLQMIMDPDFDISKFPVDEWKNVLAALRLKIESRITGGDDFNYFVQQVEEGVAAEDIKVEAPKEKGFVETVQLSGGQVRETRFYRIGAYAFHTTPNSKIIEWLFDHKNVKAVYSTEAVPQTQYQFNFMNVISVRILRKEGMFIEAAGPKAEVEEFFRFIEEMKEIDKMTTTFFPAPKRSELRVGKLEFEELSEAVKLQTPYEITRLMTQKGARADIYEIKEKDSGRRFVLRIDRSFREEINKGHEEVKRRVPPQANIAQFFESGVITIGSFKRSYQIYELIPGKDIADRLSENYFASIGPVRTAAVIEQIITGLRHLYDHGVFPGDFSYESIVVTDDDRAAIIDIPEYWDPSQELGLGAAGNTYNSSGTDLKSIVEKMMDQAGGGARVAGAFLTATEAAKSAAFSLGKIYQASTSTDVIKDAAQEEWLGKWMQAMKTFAGAKPRSELRAYAGLSNALENLGWKGSRMIFALRFGILQLPVAARYAGQYAAERERLKAQGIQVPVIEENKKALENFYTVLGRKSQTARQVFDFRMLPEQAEDLEVLAAYAIYHPEVSYTVLTLASSAKTEEFQRQLNRLSIEKFGKAARNLKIESAASREDLVRSVKTRVAASKMPSGFVSTDPRLLEEVSYQARLLRVSGDSQNAYLQNAAGILTAEKILEELPIEFLIEVHAAEDLAGSGYLQTLAAEFRSLAALMASA